MNSAERIAIEAIALLPDVPDDARDLLLRLVSGGPGRHDPDPENRQLLEEERARKARNQRERRARLRGDMSPKVTEVTGGVMTTVTGDISPVTPLDPQRETLSIVETLSESQERESQTRVRVTGRVGDASPVTYGGDATPVVRYIARTDTITAELTAIATGAGGTPPVQDVSGAWLKFCGHHDGRTINVAGEWQKWCVNEARRERSDRARGKPLPAKQQPPPSGPTWRGGLPDDPHEVGKMLNNFDPQLIATAMKLPVETVKQRLALKKGA